VRSLFLSLVLSSASTVAFAQATVPRGGNVCPGAPHAPSGAATRPSPERECMARALLPLRLAFSAQYSGVAFPGHEACLAAWHAYRSAHAASVGAARAECGGR
jgi:hypothetical protein